MYIVTLFRYIEIFRSSSSECRRSTIFNNNGRNSGGTSSSMNFNTDRSGRGQRNNRTNFRGKDLITSLHFNQLFLVVDRPYPDTPWSQNNNNIGNENGGSNDAPWRNNSRNSNFGNNNFNDNFDGGNNMFNNDSNFSSGEFDDLCILAQLGSPMIITSTSRVNQTSRCFFRH